ncbi:MAG: methyltransferase domain-containing protein, partial [Acidobacteriota bacterium]|nr:methyltransferase domain-containing protein [Acidobacteriota bacterium]
MVYGSEYFKSHCGPIPYTREHPHWLSFFSGIAERIVASLAPKRVLDAGCAMGFLVEMLRDRGVEAYGLDVSEYAIAQVRPDIAPYCKVAALEEPIAGKFDLITCIEVLEHLTEEQARAAILNMSRATDTILFSSTPSDFDEPTHVNVKPEAWWLELFAEVHFVPDRSYDARFLTPHAMLLRQEEPASEQKTADLLADLTARYDQLGETVRAQAVRLEGLESRLEQA